MQCQKFVGVQKIVLWSPLSEKISQSGDIKHAIIIASSMPERKVKKLVLEASVLIICKQDLPAGLNREMEKVR